MSAFTDERGAPSSSGSLASEARHVSPHRPPRRRYPWGAVAVLFAVVGLLAVLTKLDGLVPSLRNPFGQKNVDRSQPAVLRALEDLSEYRAATGYFQVVIDLEEDARYLPSLVRGERTLFVATGTVDAAVDFSDIGRGAVEVADDRRAVEISLPRPRLMPARVDPARSHVVSRDRGLLDRLGSVFSDSPTGERQFYLLAEQKLQAAAQEGDIVRRAEDNTRAMLDSMLRSLGFTEVTVRFEAPPA